MMTEIPVVDFSQASAPERFMRSLQETGFGVLENHPLDPQLIQQIYSQWQDFFASDLKHEYLFDANTHAGFFPATVSETAKGERHKDLKEYFHIFSPNNKKPSGENSLLATNSFDLI